MPIRSIYRKTIVPSEILVYQALASKHFLPLIEPIPIFTDEQLKQLSMPLQYFGSDHDVLLDTKKTSFRLQALIPHSEIDILEDTGHVIINCFDRVKSFLEKQTPGYTQTEIHDSI